MVPPGRVLRHRIYLGLLDSIKLTSSNDGLILHDLTFLEPLHYIKSDLPTNSNRGPGLTKNLVLVGKATIPIHQFHPAQVCITFSRKRNTDKLCFNKVPHIPQSPTRNLRRVQPSSSESRLFLPSTSLSSRQPSPPLVSQPPESFVIACRPKTYPAAALPHQHFSEPSLSIRPLNLSLPTVAVEEIAIEEDPRDEESGEERTDDGGGTEEADADVDDDESTDEEVGRVRRRRRSRSNSAVSLPPSYRSKFSPSIDLRKYKQHFTGVRRKDGANDGNGIRFSGYSRTAARYAQG